MCLEIKFRFCELNNCAQDKKEITTKNIFSLKNENVDFYLVIATSPDLRQCRILHPVL